MEGLRPLPPEAPLARALAAGRERFNARVTAARRGGLRLDPAALLAHLEDGVAPAVAAVAAEAPGRVQAVTEALFDLSLPLVAADLLGPAARGPLLPQAWRELLPRLARPLADAPGRVAAAVTNALLHLGDAPAARPAQWMSELGALARRCEGPEALLRAGQVLAWRAGLAHYRASALAVWETLPEPLARATLGLPPDAPFEREALRAGLRDPWAVPGAPAPEAAPRVVATVGGFRGLGGPFLAPPRLVAAGGSIWASDGEAVHTVHADAFGHTLVRAAGLRAADLPEAAPAPALLRDGTLVHRGGRTRLPALAEPAAAAAAGALLAVLPQRSHRLLLVACPGGWA
ncbi:MAG: hypothetical protein QM767_19660 [Anaeromyxobacter sp.]